MILNYILTHEKIGVTKPYLYVFRAGMFISFPINSEFLNFLFLELLESSRGRTGYKMRGCEK